jgi:translocation and assembly module TamA
MTRVACGARRAAGLIVLAAVLAGAVHAQGPQPAFRTEIEAPSELATALRENLELVRWQDYDAMTPELLDRLIGEASGQAADILATRGYFSPRIETRRERGDAGEIVRMTVDPGQPTRVRSVRIELTGPAAEDPESAARLEEIRAEWLLPKDAVFTQSTWDQAKVRAVAGFAREHYAGASVGASRATIDPKSHAADLELTIASGPPFVFGPVEITGLTRYPEPLVRNLSPIRPGDPFSREALERYQRRLVGTNQFASVQVTVDPDPERPQALPVRVSLIEAPAKRVDVGVGYSTDTLWRLQFDYRDVDILGSGFRLSSQLLLESKIQRLGGVIDAPARGDGWLDAYAAGLEATQIENLDTTAARVGWIRRYADERNQPAYGLGYIVERQQAQGFAAETTYALTANFWYTWRRTDDIVAPRDGWQAAVQLSAAPPGVSSRAFGRAVGKVQWFNHVARNVDTVVRAELGAVLASSSDRIPQAMLFRTGGDTTVRGYAFDSLGVQQGDAIVGGRYYALASAEGIYWVGEAWGIAAFVDAGNAFDDRAEARLAVGYGLGVRVRTPAGPLRLDVAYGRDTNQFRIHFSFGLTF